jgi:hypothetical protein
VRVVVLLLIAYMFVTMCIFVSILANEIKDAMMGWLCSNDKLASVTGIIIILSEKVTVQGKFIEFAKFTPRIKGPSKVDKLSCAF